MAKNIIILGAGASAQYGAPVMANFLEVANSLYVAGEFSDEENRRYERVSEAISKLQRAHSKSTLDLNNIESVLTVFEMAEILEPSVLEGFGDLENTIDDFKVIIQSTLFRTLRGDPDSTTDNEPTQFRGPLPGQIHDLLTIARIRNRRLCDTAILTFNYDLLFELIASARTGSEPVVELDYGTSTAIQGAVPLLKLHGSLNWFEASGSSNLKIIQLGTLFPVNLLGGFTQMTRVMKELLERVEANPEIPKKIPLIIPPCWNKRSFYPGVSNVWKRAADELSTAEYISIVGYSMPETDLFFKHLYSLGTIGKRSIKRFVVYNTDETVFPRFQSLLGPGASRAFVPRHTCASLAFGEIARNLNGQPEQSPRITY